MFSERYNHYCQMLEQCADDAPLLIEFVQSIYGLDERYIDDVNYYITGLRCYEQLCEACDEPMASE